MTLNSQCDGTYFEFQQKNGKRNILETNVNDQLFDRMSEITASWKLLNSETYYLLKQKIIILAENGTVLDNGDFDEKVLNCTVLQSYWKHYKQSSPILKKY